MIKKLIKWWNSGGNEFSGFDVEGEKTYSLTNGETFVMLFVCGAGTVACVAIIAIALVFWQR